MSLIRPELQEKLRPFREAMAAALLAVLGGWIFWLGGWLLMPLGALLLSLALGWGISALRRARFARAVEAPGMVELDEGQIGYLGPTFGGYVALAELAELRLIDLYGKRHWRLKQVDGQVLLVPVAAQGAEVLFDAFALLPGADMARIAAALDGPMTFRPLWTRPPGAALRIRPVS